jgi:hypothetical protein
MFSESLGVVAVAFMFFPSVVFWSSGVIKESLGFASLLVIAGIFVKIVRDEKPRWWEYVVAGVAVWLLWNLKYYWISVLLPVMGTSAIVHILNKRDVFSLHQSLGLWLVIFVILCGGASLLHPNFHLARLFNVIVENNAAFSLTSGGHDLIQYDSLEPHLSSILKNAPLALMSGLFRPFPWEVDNVLKAEISLENFVLLFLVVTALPQLKNFFKAPNWVLTLSVVIYVIVLDTFLALSTPNLGTLSRYKVGLLPFLFFIAAYRNPVLDHVIRTMNKKQRS